MYCTYMYNIIMLRVLINEVPPPPPPLSAPVMSCEWLYTGNKLVTASWDHTAKLWDSESAQVIHSLEGRWGL